jgi:hypothetical protein
MKKCPNIYAYIRRPLVIYDFAPDTLLNFLNYEENFVFFLSMRATAAALVSSVNS